MPDLQDLLDNLHDEWDIGLDGWVYKRGQPIIEAWLKEHDAALEARVQSLLSAGDAVVELLAEDWDGADGLIGRAATLTAAWEQAKGA